MRNRIHLSSRRGTVVFEALASVTVMLICIIGIMAVSAAYWNQVVLGTSAEIATQSAHTAFERTIDTVGRYEARGYTSERFTSTPVLPSSCGEDGDTSRTLGVNQGRIRDVGGGSQYEAARVRAQATAACVLRYNANGLLFVPGTRSSASSSQITAQLDIRDHGNFGYTARDTDTAPALNTDPPCLRTTLTVNVPFSPIVDFGTRHLVTLSTRSSIVTGYSTNAVDAAGNPFSDDIAARCPA